MSRIPGRKTLYWNSVVCDDSELTSQTSENQLDGPAERWGFDVFFWKIPVNAGKFV